MTDTPLPPELEEVCEEVAATVTPGPGAIRDQFVDFARHVLRRAGVPGMMEERERWRAAALRGSTDPRGVVESALSEAEALREERNALREAGKLPRNTRWSPEKHFEGEWVVIPKEDFNEIRALALKPKESS